MKYNSKIKKKEIPKSVQRKKQMEIMKHMKNPMRLRTHSHYKYLSQYMGLNAKSTKKCYTRLLSQNGMIS